MKFNKKFLLTLATSLFLSLPIGSAFAGDPVWDGNTVVMNSEKLSDDVYAYYPSDAHEKAPQGLPIATSGGFIAGDKGVMIIDTMLNQRLNRQIQKMVQSKTDKPITYAVNTSYHGDHSYGNMYLPETTQIIQHVNSKRYIEQHFEKDKDFMMQNFGKGRGIEEIEARTGDILVPENGKIVIDLGGKLVEIIDFGFAQTGGDLFVWEPESKVLWTGNPVITTKPSLPWLLDGKLIETVNTLTKVQQFLPDNAKIVPGHGPVMAKADLQWHIDYLLTVKTQVQKAIDEGLTLEETVQKVTMEEFKGYALFGWVHSALNVPAAYNDLKK